MTTSSFSSLPTRSCSVASTTAAGTMSQTARGLWSFLTKSSSEVEPVAPSPANCLTESALRSYTTHLWPFFCRRRTILAPILPSPTIPSCIVRAPHNFHEVEKLIAILCDCFLHGFGQSGQTCLEILSEMCAQGATA